jgi:transcriptional regulator with PAS, ATPase and Fis domain
LQNREIYRVGSNNPIPVDIRLVCATNCNLEQMVEAGSFREDLLYRINTIQIEVPPLRFRDDDILLLSEYFLTHYANKYDKSGLKLNASAKKKLQNHSWPGNIRELQHTIERCVILSEHKVLTANDFIFKKHHATLSQALEITLDDMEKNMIESALIKHDQNHSAAANQLGITRQTLYNKIKRYKL